MKHKEALRKLISVSPYLSFLSSLPIMSPSSTVPLDIGVQINLIESLKQHGFIQDALEVEEELYRTKNEKVQETDRPRSLKLVSSKK